MVRSLNYAYHQNYDFNLCLKIAAYTILSEKVFETKYCRWGTLGGSENHNTTEKNPSSAHKKCDKT